MASLAEDIAIMVRRIIKKEQGGFSTYVQGVFVAEESVDANLSTVTVLETDLRYIRKLASVGTLVAGQSVLLVQGGGIPLTIIGVVVGDVRKAV